MTLTPNTQNTPSDILGQMREEKPFYLSERVNRYVIEAMKLYATGKVKEVLRVAAELSQEMIYDRGDCDMRPEGGLILRNFQVCYATHKQSILSLETELVELINKEI